MRQQVELGVVARVKLELAGLRGNREGGRMESGPVTEDRSKLEQKGWCTQRGSATCFIG